MMTIENLQHLEIGIKTKGYEEFVGDNLIISIAIIGRLTNGSKTKYKINIKPIIEAMASKGIQLIKPLEISSKKLARKEWNLSDFLEDETPLVPKDSIIYKRSRGTSVRFLNYEKSNLEITMK